MRLTAVAMTVFGLSGLLPADIPAAESPALGVQSHALVVQPPSLVVQPPSLRARVDHLVYATPDLEMTIRQVESQLGVRAAPGGQHPGRGTRNALIALGPGRYLEIIGPDPEQPKPEAPRPFGIDLLRAARLVAWAAKTGDVAGQVREASAHGVTLGAPTPGSRRRPDGVMLTWQYTNPQVVVADGLVPFFIDWGSSPHPSLSAATGVSLVDLRAEHPRPEEVEKLLKGAGIPLNVRRGSAPALVATVDCPRGRIELR